MTSAIWVPCPSCDEYVCLRHQMHVCDCSCPPIEEWTVSPYGSLLSLQSSDQAYQAQEAQAGREQELALTGSQQAHEQTMAEQQAAREPAE